MTSKLESALNEIGWQRIRVTMPAYAAYLKKRLLDDAEDTWPKRAAAEKAKLRRLEKAVISLAEELDGLSDECKEWVGWASASSEELGEGVSKIDEIFFALEAIVPGVVYWRDVLNSAPRNTKRNNAAYRVAEVVAEIFVLGTGQKPGSGRSGITQEPNGPYSRTCRKVFSILGIRVGAQSIEPLKHAVNGLTQAQFEDLLDIRRNPTRGPLSLVTGRPKRRGPSLSVYLSDLDRKGNTERRKP